MKILLATHVFYPGIGGIETMSALLANAFVQLGHDVIVVTPVHNPDPDDFPFRVVRQPNAVQSLSLMRWCDVYLQNNISLQAIWPLLFIRRPWIVVHQTWIGQADKRLKPQDQVKRIFCRSAVNIAISQAVADSISVPSTIIGNTYRNDIFQMMNDVQRDKNLVFVGRLVSDKGADTLIEALALLTKRGLTPDLTIVGDGPERGALECLVRDLGLEQFVTFAGKRSGVDLARMLNAHEIIVVPSRWREPFGIVALEGLACGCVPVVSEGGGLKDAIGDCGITFPNGDAAALSTALYELLSSPDKVTNFRNKAIPHLERYGNVVVAKAYLNVFESVVK